MERVGRREDPPRPGPDRAHRPRSRYDRDLVGLTVVRRAGAAPCAAGAAREAHRQVVQPEGQWCRGDDDRRAAAGLDVDQTVRIAAVLERQLYGHGTVCVLRADDDRGELPVPRHYYSGDCRRAGGGLTRLACEDAGGVARGGDRLAERTEDADESLVGGCVSSPETVDVRDVDPVPRSQAVKGRVGGDAVTTGTERHESSWPSCRRSERRPSRGRCTQSGRFPSS